METVIVACITAASVVIVAVINKLRDENTQQHADSRELLANLHADVREVHADVRDVKEDVRELRVRVDKVETTAEGATRRRKRDAGTNQPI